MSQIENLTINQKVGAEVGTSAALVYDYIIKKSVNGRFFLDIEDIHSDLPIMSARSISRCVDKLVSSEYVTKAKLTSMEKFKILSRKRMDGLGIGNRVCEWCGCNTAVLNNHHFPIPRKDNGAKTVGICANCHSEFHHLTSELIIEEGD